MGCGDFNEIHVYIHILHCHKLVWNTTGGRVLIYFGRPQFYGLGSWRQRETLIDRCGRNPVWKGQNGNSLKLRCSLADGLMFLRFSSSGCRPKGPLNMRVTDERGITASLHEFHSIRCLSVTV